MIDVSTPPARRAPTAEAGTRPWYQLWILRALVALGLLSLVYYFSWWRHGGSIAAAWLALLLVLAGLYNWAQMLLSWVLYVAARHRPVPVGDISDLSVDIFVTAYHEPYPLIERALVACRAVRGVHRTWLLDDGADPALSALAERLGVGYLTRPDRREAKAGNLNAALARTDGEVIAIFDIDHAPTPDFFERTLGHFADPGIGFVQVMLSFCNGQESWVARAGAESALDFYNPTSIGMDGLGCATLVGSNAIIRRSALTSIGGYRPGLAEDLATSIALHAAGWRSAYVAEPLAPGLAPPDLVAWFTQQLKWARGVFELLLTDYPRLFGRLSWGQRLSYAVRMTYYWIGPFAAVHLLFTLLLLLGGSRVAQVDFQGYILHYAPVAICALLIRQAALRIWRHPSAQINMLWRPVALVYATWPVYTLAWFMALLRLPVGFRPTPKAPSGRLNPLWLAPQIGTTLLLIAGLVYSMAIVPEHRPLIILGFAAFQCTLQLLLLWPWLREWRATESTIGLDATTLAEL